MKASTAEELGIQTGFINKTMEVRGTERRYAVYVPRNYDPAKPWPLIVFLHGAGERGDDGGAPRTDTPTATASDGASVPTAPMLMPSADVRFVTTSATGTPEMFRMTISTSAAALRL